MMSCTLGMCRGAVVRQGLHATASALGRSVRYHPTRLNRTVPYTKQPGSGNPLPLIGSLLVLSQQHSSTRNCVKADASQSEGSARAQAQSLEEASNLSIRAEAKLEELQSKSAKSAGDDIQTALTDLKKKLSSLQAKLTEYREQFIDKDSPPPPADELTDLITAAEAIDSASSTDEAPTPHGRRFLPGFIPSFPSALHLPTLPNLSIPHLSIPGPPSLLHVLGRRHKTTVVTDGPDQPAEDDKDMGEVCTADELHYVEVKGTEWKLAMWRYRPAADAVKRNHPVLLLAGVASNAFTFDLDPQVSLARHLAKRGFDTWVVEVRGNGLTKRVTPSGEVESEVQIELQSLESILPSLRNFGESEWAKRLNVNVQDYINYLEKLLPLLERYLERIKPFLTRGSRVVDQTRNSAREFQRLFDWDFDSFLLEDVPAAMDFVKEKSAPKDGKVLAIGHSMGGILLYCLLSTKGKDAGLKGAVTLASALDYSPGSILKLILPLEIPASRLQVPAIPLGIMMRSIQPVVAWAPSMWPLTWLSKHVSANGSMDSALLAKVYGMNFGTVSVKALLQLATVFQPGGLQNRDGKIKYMEELKSTDVPILAVAGDRDTICPPNTVEATAKVVPKHLLEYHVFGKDHSHYGHYDLLGHRDAPKEVFPVVFDFLEKQDALEESSEPSDPAQKEESSEPTAT